MSNAPLSGLKVIELARILAGPWIGQTLADLGADVIKVESPQGDDTRTWGPPFIDDGVEKAAAYFHACNRGKRSITADFTRAEDIKTLRDLIASADVVIENFKVGGLAKYGLDYDSLKELNPRLVYCSVTGFGQDGPYAQRAGYDFMIQGMSGIMDLTGEPDGAPQKVGVAFADIFTGLYGVIAIQAALAQRLQTGRGQFIDMALFDCMSAVLANQAMNYAASGIVPKRMGNNHPNIAPYQTFSVADGHIIIACGNDGQFVRLCGVLGLSELATTPEFSTNSARVAHREQLTTVMEDKTKQFERDDLLARLEAATVPAGPINTVADLFADPQFAFRQMKITPDGVPGIRTPIVFSDAELETTRRAPRLGEHTAEVLAEIRHGKD
ncbi:MULTISPECIES: CaiB/BaiF CoA transferase family protein [Rhizobium/Agrobacterium group]|uniref:CaiB/BaiF CoA transferase family protein n=1 Tax=Rhizobium/Agrobacterium group TaxID=227290 RepID=UPI000B3FD7FE|nr:MULTISPECIES: CaiB/BaiF CoA-transferase family protein [Rhizobium/Agrobacterium group]MCF1481447.1 CoA transferase [Allorhizobium ampelinum]NSZ45298.1 CoA transferase [Agrobacterium vitis]NTA29045.1 CoA transferase [Allorhizobium ampelinum]OVE90981.1 CoA transferase [Allorhizobium ampelinum]